MREKVVCEREKEGHVSAFEWRGFRWCENKIEGV